MAIIMMTVRYDDDDDRGVGDGGDVGGAGDDGYGDVDE